MQLCASTLDVGTMSLRPYALMPYAPSKKAPYAPTPYAPTPLRPYALFYRFFLESYSYLLTTANTLTIIITISVGSVPAKIVQLCASTPDVVTMPLRP